MLDKIEKPKKRGKKVTVAIAPGVKAEPAKIDGKGVRLDELVRAREWLVRRMGSQSDGNRRAEITLILNHINAREKELRL